jgi:uncharacterized protein YoxC
MENNEKLLALMEKMEENSRKQLLFTKVLSGLTALVLVFALVLVGYLCSAAGYVQELAGQLTGIVNQVTGIADQAVIVLDNLETVTNELAQVDLNSMIADVDELVGSSQSAVEDALGKINTIDIDTLNQAIKDLAAVVEPLARLTRW